MVLPAFFRFLPQHAALRAITIMRSVALAGQLLAVAIVQRWLRIDLPLLSLLAVIALYAAFNGWAWFRLQRTRPASDRELFIQLFVDVSALSALLYFSGGATNPFVSGYLPVLAVGAAILPWRYAVALALFSVACYSAMTSVYIPLHIHDSDRAVAYHLSGMWANFAVSAGLITWFVAHMSWALRERDRQLAQARELQLQNERLLALGTQAASAAHEMGTPLSTVAIIVDDLRQEAGRDVSLAAYSEDLAVIDAQIALCKEALDGMKMQADSGAVPAPKSVSLTAWMNQLIEKWRLRHPATRIDLALPANDAHVVNEDAIGQMLQTLLDNAAQITRGNTPIQLSLRIESGTAMIQVHDRGDGIPAEMLCRLGHEPVRSAYGGQGIGLMLAFATARQVGAAIDIASCRAKGTTVTLTFPLA
ncbi:MAG TPA: ATP-binding protein [Burkholderiaceae bacterium]|nr:ATP-binding protein [Burkholderiaceae bacterium]